MKMQSDVAKDIPELFRERLKFQQSTNLQLRNIRSTLSEDKAASRTAKVYFDHISQRKKLSVIDRFPQAVKLLYQVSKKLIEGEYGPDLQLEAMSLSSKLLTKERMLTLLSSPGIQFEKIEKNIQDEDLETLVDVFRESLSNLANPSNVIIKMIAQTGENLDEVVAAALNIKNKEERTKSLVYIVDLLLTRNTIDDIHQAMELINHIEEESERIKPLFKLIDKLSYPNKAEARQERIPNEIIRQIVEIAEKISDLEIRHKALKNIAIGFARHNNVEECLRVANLISIQDIRAYSKSSSIKMLVNNKRFQDAIWLLGHISELDHREDAIAYIIIGLLEDHQDNEGIAFISQLKEPREIKHAAKTAISSYKGRHELDKAQHIKDRFLQS